MADLKAGLTLDLAPEGGVSSSDHSCHDQSVPTSAIARYYQRLEKKLLAYKFEARGIRRVETEERHSLKSFGYFQVAILWFSINLAGNNIALGMLGPAVFRLSFLDASLCAILGVTVGCLAVAYIATLGPRSGCRSLVVSRYAMGWWPTKIPVICLILLLLGYSMIDAVVAGQLLSAVSPHESLSVVVGIVITAVITWAICSFGYSIVHMYERYAWIPQFFVFSILAGAAGKHFDMSSPTEGDINHRVTARLAYFGICFSAAITYSAFAADYFVYYPEETPRWKVFSATMIGLTTSFAFALVLGIGLGSGKNSNNAWKEAYDISQGALIVEGFAPLGTFGKVCSVITALGLIANIIPCNYSVGVDFQMLGRYTARVPRLVWNSLATVIYAVCALAGREHLAEIFTNFLALEGYWVSIWIAILLEEQYIFRRKRGFDWTVWNDRNHLPIGIAGLIAFLVGWAGAILSMSQVWYVGPIARLAGGYGADLGNYLGFTWAGIVFLPLRYLELRRYGR